MVSGFESLSRNQIAWRYRLGVRTDGSQPSDRGSNPRSATSLILAGQAPRGAPVTPRLALALLLPLAACGAPAATRAKGPVARAVDASLASGTERFDNALWDHLLAEGTRDGLVQYLYMKDRRDRLEAYLSAVAAAPLDRLAPGHLEALLINAYNASTVLSILDHPRVTSIKEIPGVWDAAKHRIGGFDLTLDEIEHRILRPFFRDPRIHFVLNCASKSCAPLPPWAVDGDRIDAQLEERTRSFLGDPRNVKVERGGLLLSKYFDWYGADFTTEGWRGAAPSAAEYVARYASPEVAAFIQSKRGRPAIGYLEYDWSLNAAPLPAPVPPQAPSPPGP